MYAGTGVVFTDRTDAGRQLAAQLRQYADHKDVVVLALPRSAPRSMSWSA